MRGGWSPCRAACAAGAPHLPRYRVQVRALEALADLRAPPRRQHGQVVVVVVVARRRPTRRRAAGLLRSPLRLCVAAVCRGRLRLRLIILLSVLPRLASAGARRAVGRPGTLRARRRWRIAVRLRICRFCVQGCAVRVVDLALLARLAGPVVVLPAALHAPRLQGLLGQSS